MINSSSLLRLPFQSIYKFYNALHEKISIITHFVITKFLYMGYHYPPKKIIKKRIKVLTDIYKAKKLPCKNESETFIDNFYISSQSDTKKNNVIIICLNMPYQKLHPQHWDYYLKSGSNVLLWNPVLTNPITYSKNLSSIISYLRKQNKKQIIALKGYCAATDPMIKVAADKKDSKIHLIIDRGHGDIGSLLSSFSLFGRLAFFQNIAKKYFSCGGIEKITKIPGKILFITTDKKSPDQVMNYGKNKNFTRDLFFKRQLIDYKKDQLLELPNGDHWSRWDVKTYNKELDFLKKVRVITQFTPLKEEDIPPLIKTSFFKRKCVPYFKTCY